MKKKAQKILSFPVVRQILISVLCAAQALAALTLSLSSVRFLETGIRFSIPWYCLAMTILCLLHFTIGVMSAKPILAPFICTLILNIIALINYYELRLHGTVLTHQDIRNIATAYRQIGNYKFELTLPVRCIIISFLLLQFILAFLYKCVLAELKISKRFGAISAALLILLPYVLIYSPLAIDTSVGWSWERKYFTDSFVVGTLENVKRAMQPMIKPEGYSEEELQDCVSIQASEENFPDIIMILNESYYDVEHLVDLDLDCNVMEAYCSLNAYKGYATVPYAGGGTNASEYELLTGNSLTILSLR